MRRNQRQSRHGIDFKELALKYQMPPRYPPPPKVFRPEDTPRYRRLNTGRVKQCFPAVTEEQFFRVRDAFNNPSERDSGKIVNNSLKRNAGEIEDAVDGRIAPDEPDTHRALGPPSVIQKWYNATTGILRRIFGSLNSMLTTVRTADESCVVQEGDKRRRVCMPGAFDPFLPSVSRIIVKDPYSEIKEDESNKINHTSSSQKKKKARSNLALQREIARVKRSWKNNPSTLEYRPRFTEILPEDEEPMDFLPRTSWNRKEALESEAHLPFEEQKKREYNRRLAKAYQHQKEEYNKVKEAELLRKRDIYWAAERHLGLPKSDIQIDTPFFKLGCPTYFLPDQEYRPKEERNACTSSATTVAAANRPSYTTSGTQTDTIEDSQIQTTFQRAKFQRTAEQPQNYPSTLLLSDDVSPPETILANDLLSGIQVSEFQSTIEQPQTHLSTPPQARKILPLKKRVEKDPQNKTQQTQQTQQTHPSTPLRYGRVSLPRTFPAEDQPTKTQLSELQSTFGQPQIHLSTPTQTHQVPPLKTPVVKDLQIEIQQTKQSQEPKPSTPLQTDDVSLPKSNVAKDLQTKTQQSQQPEPSHPLQTSKVSQPNISVAKDLKSKTQQSQQINPYYPLQTRETLPPKPNVAKDLQTKAQQSQQNQQNQQIREVSPPKATPAKDSQKETQSPKSQYTAEQLHTHPPISTQTRNDSLPTVARARDLRLRIQEHLRSTNSQSSQQTQQTRKISVPTTPRTSELHLKIQELFQTPKSKRTQQTQETQFTTIADSERAFHAEIPTTQHEQTRPFATLLSNEGQDERVSNIETPSAQPGTESIQTQNIVTPAVFGTNIPQTQDLQDLPDAPPKQTRAVHFEESIFPTEKPIAHTKFYSFWKRVGEAASPYGRTTFRDMQNHVLVSPASTLLSSAAKEYTISKPKLDPEQSPQPYFKIKEDDADSPGGDDTPVALRAVSIKFSELEVSWRAKHEREAEKAREERAKTLAEFRKLELRELAERRRKMKERERLMKEEEAELQAAEEKRHREAKEAREAKLKAAEEKKRREAEEAKIRAEKRAAARAREASTLGPWAPSIIKPVSEDWLNKTDQVMSNGSDTGILTPTSLKTPLTRRDMVKLLEQYHGPRDAGEKGWLNDEIVNSYLEALVSRANENAETTPLEHPPKYHTFSTFLYRSFRDNGGYNGVKRWAKRARIDGKKLLQVDTVLIPINPGGHWTLIAISGTRKTVNFYDSMGGAGKAFLDFAKAYVGGVLGTEFNESEWHIKQEPSVQQENYTDCGVFVCMNALALISRRMPLKAFKASEMHTARQMIAATLLNGGFRGEFDL